MLQERAPDTLLGIKMVNARVSVLVANNQEAEMRIGLCFGVMDDGLHVVNINANAPNDTNAFIDLEIGR